MEGLRRFRCSQCRGIIEVETSQPGMVVQCPSCEANLRVPPLGPIGPPVPNSPPPLSSSASPPLPHNRPSVVGALAQQRNPAKRAMLVVTIIWPISAIVLVLFLFATRFYSMEALGASGYFLDYGRTVSSSRRLSISVVFSIKWTVIISTGCYVLSMLGLLGWWFASKND